MSTREHTFEPSTYAVVRIEDIRTIARLRADLIAGYKPANSQELFSLERLAIAQQDLMRCNRLVNGFYTASLNEALDPDGRPLRLL